ncbi:MAG: hypothetical protein BZY88_19850 [SAR202 cluster bacterium Io17-Chloro-G9]|nr:MAG: hypothetical protein BZY88_19850 [SAR202 cluster bacterium Io17-Chloro-G9]
MTSYGEPRVWLEGFPQGQATQIYHDHLGLRYPGEVIRAASWSPSWGEPLSQNIYFRIVLMSRRRGTLQPQIGDARIAVCFPGTGSSRRRTGSIRELATIRETQANYPSSSDLDADLIRTTLRRRQEGLEQELLGEESVRYSQGAVVTGADSAINDTVVAGIFAGVEPNEWFQRLAGRLLDQAYPELPVATSSLNRTMTPEEVPELHRAIFNHSGGNTNALSEFGPALGVSSHSSPQVFDSSHCRTFDMLRDWLSQQPGPADWPAAHRYLAHEIGLTGPLAHLFLLLFAHIETPPVEIKLTSLDGVSMVDGSPLLTRRLTHDLLPLLPWDPGFAEPGAQIGRESDPELADTFQHFSYLSPSLASHIPETDTAMAEAVLARDIESLSQELSQSHSLLAQLYQATGDPEFPELADPLERLGVILGAAPAGFLEVYRRIRESYSNPSLLKDDISVLHRIAQISAFYSEILELRSYLDRAEIPSSTLPNLWVESQGLQAALSLGSLIHPAGRTMESLIQEIDGFKSSYGAAYKNHHTQLHQDLPAYQRNLAAARRKSQALTLLNTIPELPGAEGLDLANSLEQLIDGPSPCPVDGEALKMEDNPICGSCEITLETALAVDRLNMVSAAIDASLAVQNKILSDLLVGKIMQETDDPRLDDLIRIVQTSDLSVLSNTLNQDMADFIHRLLA